jgi:hypothetical protein
MGVNVPLLRKAVEWAETEAAKPRELCEWEQNFWHLPPSMRALRLESARRAEESPEEYWGEEEASAYTKAPECGTCYCVAGFIVSQRIDIRDISGWSIPDQAAEFLGIDYKDAQPLFDADNTIEDVRRIAEDLAGERL